MPVIGYSGGGKPMRLFVLAAAAVLLSACANSIESRTAQGGGVGLAYMAPMRLLTVTATRALPAESAAVTRARTALVNAEAELTTATSALQTATQEATDARELANAGPTIAALQTAATNKEIARDTARARVTVATTAVTNAHLAYTNLTNASRDHQAVEEAHRQLASSVRDLATAQLASERASPTDRPGLQPAIDLANQRVTRDRDTYARALAVAGPLRETIEVAMGPAVGDPDARFVANISTNWFRSARGRIVVGQNGLLQSANLIVDGQLDETLVGVAQSLVSLSASGGAVKLFESGERTRSEFCGADGEFLREAPTQLELTAQPVDSRPIISAAPLAVTTLSISFDPVSEIDVHRVNRALCGAGFSYRIGVRDPRLDASPAVIDPRIATPTFRQTAASLTPSFRTMCGLTVGRGDDAPRRCPGLAYRQNEPMHVDLVRFDREQGLRTYTERSFSFSVPNAAPVDVLRYDDAMFVTRRDDVGFVDGSLVSVDFDRPSEAAVAASIPFRIVRGTTEALSELVQLRVNYTNQQTALTQAEQAAAAAQASGAPSAEVAQLESARRILELRLAVEEARQRLQEAEAQAATSD